MTCFGLSIFVFFGTIISVYFACKWLYTHRKMIKFGNKYKDRNLVNVSNPWYLEWIAIRACHCGYKGVSNTQYKNIVVCKKCGALHSTKDASDPIAITK